jgi:glycopeptide antibiotics resistance protein
VTAPQIRRFPAASDGLAPDPLAPAATPDWARSAAEWPVGAAIAAVVARTRVRLGFALLGYMIAVTLVITLVPFQFAMPSAIRIMWTGTPFDIVSNVLLFAPLGFLYRLARGAEQKDSFWRVLLIGIACSAMIELAQLLEIERFTSPLDVATNGLGAAIGAWTYDRVAQRLVAQEAGLVGRLSLELPLMGLIYLLLPLLWIDGLALGSDPARVWLTLLIALFGASILGALQRHHFGPKRRVGAGTMAAATMAWFAVGAFPALARAPLAVAAIAVGIGAFVWLRTRTRDIVVPINRRFEIPTLRAAAPFYAAYLVSLPLVSLHGGASPWSVSLGLPSAAATWQIVDILRLLESLAAFTLLGFMLAELRGRAEERVRATLRHAVMWGAVVAAASEALHGFIPGSSASLMLVALSTAAAGYGAWLYVVQRAHVKAVTQQAKVRSA